MLSFLIIIFSADFLKEVRMQIGVRGIIRAHEFQIAKLALDVVRENSISAGFLYANTKPPRQTELNIHNSRKTMMLLS